MGCFISTTNFDKEASEHPQLNTCSRAPQSLLEEETVVKEVLSETPKSEPSISRFSTNGTFSPKNPTFPSPNVRQHFEFVKNPRRGFKSVELSEDASEICSDFADRDDDVSKIRNISPVKYRNRQVSGDRLVGKRTQPSPGRSRSAPGLNGDANVRRIGSDTGPGRRSTAPATRLDRTTRSTSSPGRCPSARRSTPDRVTSTRKMEDDRDAKMTPTNHESLENPLVSLECFIFL